jgi:hypothetical protein
MAYPATKKRGRQLTEIQEQYIDILVDRYFLYWGGMPHGHKKKVADELGCSAGYLTQLDSGENPYWIEERNRRFRERVPLSDPMAQLAVLQEMLDDKLERRRSDDLPLTKQDPVQIVETARKITHGQAYLQAVEEGRKRPSVNATFNFEGISDEQLSRVIEYLTHKIRDGDDLGELGEIIEGSFEPVGDSAAEGVETRAIPAQVDQGQESAP